MRKWNFLSALLILLSVEPVYAGLLELSATYNYRRTNYDEQRYDLAESGTGSIAYYFWELSALELSYTRGAALQVQPEYKAYQDLTGFGANLVITMADRQSAIKPYIRAGAIYIIKNVRYFINTFPTVSVETAGIAPTAGAGFKLMVTQQLAIKIGAEVTTSPMFAKSKKVDPPTTTAPPEEKTTYDFTGTAGISFIF